jgi:hypothetical protein
MCIFHSSIRAMRTGSTVDAATVENTIPANDTGESGWGSRACSDQCRGKDDHERTQPYEEDMSKFRLSSPKACVSNVAVQPASFGDPVGNYARLHDCQRRNKAET